MDSQANLTGWRLRAQHIISSPVYATVTTVLAVIAGLLGSVYQDDIAAAFPLTLRGPWAELSPRALGFWASVVLFAILFFFRQWWDDVNRERLGGMAQRIEKGTSRIEYLVHTMPPKAFQTQLAQTIAAASRGLARTLPRQRPAELVPADLAAFIRSLLNSIARLALIYDDEPQTADGPVRYAVNVMVFVPRQEGGWPHDLKRRICFCGEDVDLDQLLGVLELRVDLSATSDISELPPPDSSIPSIALPVPREPRKNGRWTALPGAPKAFLTDSVDGYDDSTTLAQWCTASGDFRPSIVQELSSYFTEGGGKEVRSFISRPLHNSEGRPIGVLNLHSNHPDILGNFDERMPTFQAMLTPIFMELQFALETLISAEASGRGDIASATH